MGPTHKRGPPRRFVFLSAVSASQLDEQAHGTRTLLIRNQLEDHRPPHGPREERQQQEGGVGTFRRIPSRCLLSPCPSVCTRRPDPRPFTLEQRGVVSWPNPYEVSPVESALRDPRQLEDSRGGWNKRDYLAVAGSSVLLLVVDPFLRLFPLLRLQRDGSSPLARGPWPSVDLEEPAARRERRGLECSPSRPRLGSDVLLLMLVRLLVRLLMMMMMVMMMLVLLTLVGFARHHRQTGQVAQVATGLGITGQGRSSGRHHNGWRRATWAGELPEHP